MAGLTKIIFLLAVFFQVLDPGVGECPDTLVTEIESGISKREERQIVKHINRFRKHLTKGEIKGQPRAINMTRIRYSTELAKVAQAAIDNCRPVENPPTLNGNSFGINEMASLSMTEVPRGGDWKQTIDYWISMSKLYDYPTIKDNRASYYINLANAASTKIGCGYKHYEDKRNVQYTFKKVHICLFDSKATFSEPPYYSLLT